MEILPSDPRTVSSEVRGSPASSGSFRGEVVGISNISHIRRDGDFL